MEKSFPGGTGGGQFSQGLAKLRRCPGLLLLRLKFVMVVPGEIKFYV
jgi:hypothetical protein